MIKRPGHISTLLWEDNLSGGRWGCYSWDQGHDGQNHHHCCQLADLVWSEMHSGKKSNKCHNATFDIKVTMVKTIIIIASYENTQWRKVKKNAATVYIKVMMLKTIIIIARCRSRFPECLRAITLILFFLHIWLVLLPQFALHFEVFRCIHYSAW